MEVSDFMKFSEKELFLFVGGCSSKFNQIAAVLKEHELILLSPLVIDEKMCLSNM